MARRLFRRTRFASPFVMVLGCGKPPEQPSTLPVIAAVDAGATAHATATYPPDYFKRNHRDYDSEPVEPDEPTPMAADAGLPPTNWKPCEQIDPTINCNPPRPASSGYLDLRVIGRKQRPQGGLEIILAVPDKAVFDDRYASTGVFIRKDGKLLDVRVTIVKYTESQVTGVVEQREEVPSDHVRIERKARR